jgi:hypothetical protein
MNITLFKYSRIYKIKKSASFFLHGHLVSLDRIGEMKYECLWAIAVVGSIKKKFGTD